MQGKKKRDAAQAEANRAALEIANAEVASAPTLADSEEDEGPTDLLASKDADVIF